MSLNDRLDSTQLNSTELSELSLEVVALGDGPAARAHRRRNFEGLPPIGRGAVRARLQGGLPSARRAPPVTLAGLGGGAGVAGR